MIADTKKLTQEAVELLQNLIRTESISRNEDIAADLLQNYMHSKNLPTHRSGNNIWTIAPDFDESRQTILLNAHIDTVKPSSSYTRNPFETGFSASGFQSAEGPKTRLQSRLPCIVRGRSFGQKRNRKRSSASS